jgi:hypothetical protein
MAKFKNGNKTGKGRPPGSKNKSTLFKYFIEEMEKKGVDLYQMWLDAINRNDDKIANAISRAFPHISQRPALDVNLDTDVDELVIIVNGAKEQDETASNPPRTSKQGIPKQ